MDGAAEEGITEGQDFSDSFLSFSSGLSEFSKYSTIFPEFIVTQKQQSGKPTCSPL